jgi:integrase
MINIDSHYFLSGLGHTDINTTMNIYAHMTANMEEKASQKFEKLMEDLL